MYSFDDKKHCHKWNDKPLMGVTTVLSVISKPMLIQWAANMACDYVLDRLGRTDYGDFTDDKSLVWTTSKDIIKEARTAHRKKKEKAGDWGTAVHKAVEEWIKNQKEPTDLTEEHQMTAFNNFKNWATENKVKFIESEKHVYSEEMWVGGIVDLVFEMDGKRYIGDIKTSSGIYNEAFFQMGAYELCLIDMGYDKVDGYLVINLKKDGTMDLKVAENREINKEAFKSALSLHKIIKSLA
jgi:CRISPR/Cas system-associated exonuclease Cas4 (RecB family)